MMSSDYDVGAKIERVIHWSWQYHVDAGTAQYNCSSGGSDHLNNGNDGP